MAGVGKNGSELRMLNRSAILKLVNDRGEISRKEIAEALDLTPAAISNITNELIKEGILMESGTRSDEAKSGRKEVLLCLNKHYFKMLGAYIATREVGVFCMNFAGDILFQDTIVFQETDSGEYMLNCICDVFDQYLEKFPQEDRSSILGVGLAVKGIVDTKNGVSLHSFGLWEDNLPVLEIVKKRMPFKVIVNNNVKCIAYAEHMLCANHSSDNMIFIKYGPLIGGAFISDDKIYNGYDYQAMNLGHMIADVNGNICRCGRRGCLETIVGFDVMAKLLEIQYSPSLFPILYRLTGGDKKKIDMETILQCYDLGEEMVKRVVGRAIGYLAVQIANLISTINPQRIVFYGRPFESEAFRNELICRIRDVAGDTNSTSIGNSIRNMKLDYEGCAAIVWKDFLEAGSVMRD